MNPAIRFFYTEKIHPKLASPTRIKTWIRRIFKEEGRTFTGLNYIFCSDRYLLKMNKEYLGHNTLTDIITFDLSEGIAVEGEIYISLERVKANSISFNRPFAEEWRRVMAHGVLHLLGYNDKKPLEKAKMRRKEEACLSLY